ncbi:NAD(P)-dependent oxidoreductase [Streptomyces sp. NPDC020802]|uniref:NAD(P)-dependent oxidoreductase n=1 Tax=Streptomyces sp. NPDC020802 TaxID=3365094 RepID=UPI0037B12CC6
MRIGFIGPGRMGRPMVDRLVAAGHDVTVYARRPGAAAALAADRLNVAASVPETVDGADAVFVVVLTDQELRSVCLGPDGAVAAMAPGAALVQHTTCDPATVVSIAEAGAARRVAVLDAALSGGPHDIQDGRLTLWVGADDDTAWDRMLPLMETYASPILRVGAPGDGQRVKLVNNALFVAQVGLAVDAARLAASLGVTEEVILAALQHGSGASRALSVVARGGSVAAVADRLADLMAKDVAVVREVADRAGADLGVIGAVLASEAVEERVLGKVPGTRNR